MQDFIALLLSGGSGVVFAGIVGAVFVFRFFWKPKNTSSITIGDIAEFNGIDPRMTEAGRVVRHDIEEPQ